MVETPIRYCYEDYFLSKKSFLQQVEWYMGDTDKTWSCIEWLDLMTKYIIK